MIYTATKAGLVKLAQQNLLAPEAWASVYEFISRPDLNEIELGRYELAGGAYAVVQEYMSKESARYESHKKYIDIQMLSKGEEYVDMRDGGARTILSGYNEEKDIEFFEQDLPACDSSELLLLNPDNLIMIFPGEPHKPGLKVGESAPVRKILFKIPYKY